MEIYIFIFVLPPLHFGILNSYGRKMDEIDTLYDGCAWCSIKITTIQINFSLTFRRSSYAGHLQIPISFVTTSIEKLVFATSMSGMDPCFSHFMWVVRLHENPSWNGRHAIPHMNPLLYVVLALSISIPITSGCHVLAFIRVCVRFRV